MAPAVGVKTRDCCSIARPSDAELRLLDVRHGLAVIMANA
jgi:hypothetical protein